MLTDPDLMVYCKTVIRGRLRYKRAYLFIFKDLPFVQELVSQVLGASKIPVQVNPSWVIKYLTDAMTLQRLFSE